jgi:apolipoprotein D and lipocalin family protein
MSSYTWIAKNISNGLRHWQVGAEYEYAVVGHPKRNFGWILSRTKELPEDVLKGIISRIEAQGYNFSKFIYTNQKDYGN